MSPLFAVEAEELLEAGKIDDAIELCEEGLKHYPDYPAALSVLARAHELKGDNDTASEKYSFAEKQFPHFSNAKFKKYANKAHLDKTKLEKKNKLDEIIESDVTEIPDMDHTDPENNDAGDDKMDSEHLSPETEKVQDSSAAQEAETLKEESLAEEPTPEESVSESADLKSNEEIEATESDFLEEAEIADESELQENDEIIELDDTAEESADVEMEEIIDAQEQATESTLDDHQDEGAAEDDIIEDDIIEDDIIEDDISAQEPQEDETTEEQSRESDDYDQTLEMEEEAESQSSSTQDEDSIDFSKEFESFDLEKSVDNNSEPIEGEAAIQDSGFSPDELNTVFQNRSNQDEDVSMAILINDEGKGGGYYSEAELYAAHPLAISNLIDEPAGFQDPSDNPNAASNDKFKELAGRLEKAKIPVADDDITENIKVEKMDVITDTIAGILENQGAYQEAIDAWNKLSEMNPERAEFYSNKIQKLYDLLDE